MERHLEEFMEAARGKVVNFRVDMAKIHLIDRKFSKKKNDRINLKRKRKIIKIHH